MAIILKDWVSPLSLASFKREYLGRQPFAQADTARSAVPLLTWQTLDGLLRCESADVLVVARAQLLDVARPRNLAELRTLMQHGIGVVIRRAELHEPSLADTALSFEQELGGESHIQIFATPGNTYGFGWHYDQEEVFIAQTCGKKDYFFRQNTVIQDVFGERLDFEAFRREVSPLGTVTLIAGDCLYVPSGWWHMAKCIEDSLSISIGVLLGDNKYRQARL